MAHSNVLLCVWSNHSIICILFRSNRVAGCCMQLDSNFRWHQNQIFLTHDHKYYRSGHIIDQSLSLIIFISKDMFEFTMIYMLLFKCYDSFMNKLMTRNNQLPNQSWSASYGNEEVTPYSLELQNRSLTIQYSLVSYLEHPFG